MRYLGFFRQDNPDEELQKITIERDGKEPITFNGRLINQKRIENEQYDLTLKLYLLEDMKVMLESKYIDPTQSVHKALEFDSIHAAGLYMQQVTEDLKNDRVQKNGLIQ